MHRSTIIVAFSLSLSGIAAAQAQGGGAAAGIGRSFEAAGRSVAARDLQRKLGGTLVKAVAREKSTARKTSTVTRPRTGSAARPTAAAKPVDDTAAYFKPDSRSDAMTSLANEIGSNPTERQQLLQIFTATKQAFEKEVAAKGRSNNLPAAFTFFIATTVTVYRDDPEPTDQAIDNLWDGMSGALTEMPELSKLTNAEKQTLYDMLVALSGFVLAGYMEGKNSGDADTAAIFKQLSGELIRSILKTDPETLRFNQDGLNIIN